MRLKKVHISNFRKLDDVSMALNHNLTVIVGPNATGKTSIFEAIRLCKSILMPRTHDEVGHVLVSLGASTPHVMFGQFQYDFSSLAGDVTKPLEVCLSLGLTPEEISSLQEAAPQVAQNIIAGQLGQTNPQSRLGLIQYFSSENGRQHQETIVNEVLQRLEAIRTVGTIDLHLTITAQDMHGGNHIDQALGAALESLVEPSKAIFSYFPADRALPPGEVNVQLHSGDMKAHVDSHFANAATKYPRLKQVIVNRLIAGGQKTLEAEFAIIFNHLLPGKKFKAIVQKPVGTISVRILDEASGREFDIDSMSSGEKGLILTYLLMRTSLANGGIVLIDEPELHLNPAVCKKLLGFLNEYICAAPMDVQVVLCTHSAEILSLAFERAEFALFELLNGTSLTPLLRGDREEMYDALQRLGVSPSDSLVYRGFVFVEGDDDVELYDKGFSDALQGYKISHKGGRNQLEQEIPVFKKAEQEGKLDKIHLFIFDNDRKPLRHESTRLVKIIQLEHYCVENYLLDNAYLYNLIRELGTRKPESRAALDADIRDCAFTQLKMIVAMDIYGDLQKLNCQMSQSARQCEDYPDIATALRTHLTNVQDRMTLLSGPTWTHDFIAGCRAREQELMSDWEQNYLSLASGKKLFECLQRKYEINEKPIRMKSRLMEKIAQERFPAWRKINEQLQGALAATDLPGLFGPG